MKIQHTILPIVRQTFAGEILPKIAVGTKSNSVDILDTICIGESPKKRTSFFYNKFGSLDRLGVRNYSTSVDQDKSNLITKMKKTAISPKRSENYSEWYQKVISVAELAENSDVRGCMVIKPWGYSIWEKIQSILDKKLKSLGSSNAYFPLLIPLSYLEKEAQHVDGFAKECAVVTHHRLEVDKFGKLIPSSPLKEPLVIRPTSETIIGESFAKWVKSYRDLPLIINQWANVMRWEMRPRLFLRTSEFLWQEGHTVHKTSEEALSQTMKILDLYETFAKDVLAINVIKGKKTMNERFPGAVDTYTIEAMMQDKKALQMGTSHFLGQNFAKSHKIQFSDENQRIDFGWTTSWGVSTRLIGGVIMSHSDDNGLILPPKISPYQIVIIPIFINDKIVNYANKLQDQISAQIFNKSNITVHVDLKDMRSGEKFWHWVTKGVPLIVQVGEKEILSNNLKYIDRTTDLSGDFLPYEEFVFKTPDLLTNIQNTLLLRSKSLCDSNTVSLQDFKDFKDFFNSDNPGFASCYSLDSTKIEEFTKPMGVTSRCIVEEGNKEGRCIFTGEKTSKKIIFAKSY